MVRGRSKRTKKLRIDKIQSLLDEIFNRKGKYYNYSGFFVLKYYRIGPERLQRAYIFTRLNGTYIPPDDWYLDEKYKELAEKCGYA